MHRGVALSCETRWYKQGRESRDAREEDGEENYEFDCRLAEFKMPLTYIYIYFLIKC